MFQLIKNQKEMPMYPFKGLCYVVFWVGEERDQKSHMKEGGSSPEENLTYKNDILLT